MFATKKMNVRKLVLVETGTYNDQWARPYETCGNTTEVITRLGELLETSKVIQPASMTTMFHSFIRPTPQVQGNAPISIVNGWDKRRFRFFMDVVSEDQMGSISHEYVIGYTDHSQVSIISNELDDNMVFHINTVMKSRMQRRRTPFGTQEVANLVDASHVLADSQYEGLMGRHKSWSMRPEDVFTSIDLLDLQGDTGSETVIDGQAILTGTPRKSKRVNTVAPSYMANILNSYLQHSRSHEYGSNSEILDASAQAVRSESITDDPFMAWLRDRNGHQNAHRFTWRDLNFFDANVRSDMVTHIKRANATFPSFGRRTFSGLNENGASFFINGDGEHQTGATRDWRAADPNAQLAVNIAQNIPGYMMEYGVSAYRFVVTNDNVRAEPIVRCLDFASLMEGVEMSSLIASLNYRLEKEFFTGILHAYDYGIRFNLTANVDLFGETRIELSLDGEPTMEYCVPSFSDALFVPVVTQSQSHLDLLSNDFRDLTNEISSHFNSGSSIIGGGWTPGRF